MNAANEAPPRRAANNALQRLLRRKLAWLSGGTLFLLLMAGIAGPLVITPDMLEGISDNVLQPPSAAYFLGSDELGRSLLPQLIEGARVSLTVGLLSGLVATLIGVCIGAIAGYVGGKVDGVLLRITEFFQIMPTFILAALIVAIAGPGESRVIIVIALLAWPESTRLMRGEVLRLRNAGFVEAARCLGYTETRILVTEVVPNAIAPVIALSTLTAAYAILIESALSFLGLTSPDVISWGSILKSGQNLMFQAWWISAFAGAAIFITALSFNVLGDCFREALNPRQAEE